MPIKVRDIRGLEGPNIYYLQPAVKLEVWSDSDLRRPIADAIKNWSQQVGVVIGALRQEARPENGGWTILTTWTTPLPLVGERIAQAVVADLQAAERDDPDYSHDQALFATIDERKREEPPLPLLQLYAEAQVRGLPFVPHGDGKITLGSGARGWTFDAAETALGLPVQPPWERIGAVPIVAVTGTNGKTTTTRLIAHMLAAIGLRVGRSDTDGIWIADRQIDEGDWAGFGGARRILTDPGVDVAVLETSRGGILRRGLGFTACDVGVVTNIAADHLGELGVETLEQMALAKGVVIRATKPEGLAVLNADDPLVLHLGELATASVCLFSAESGNQAVREYLDAGGAAITADADGVAIVFDTQRGHIPFADIPATFGGAARHNVSNVAAAIAACLGLGVGVEQIAAALRSFTPDAAHNSNRLNVFERDGITVVFDYAHNVAGLASLIEFGRRLLERTRGTGRLLLILGGPGDRPDEQIREQGRLAGAAADRLLLHEEERYLRGRELGETTALYREGALAAGLDETALAIHTDELAALDEALSEARSDDVVLVAAHAQRDGMLQRLEAWRGGRGKPQAKAWG